jgi:uncharacterized protein YkwD
MAAAVALLVVLLPAPSMATTKAAPEHGTNGASTGKSGGARLVDTSAGGDIPGGDLGHLAVEMWQMVNNDRTSPATRAETSGQAHPLRWDPQLAAVALSHSQEMAATDVFSHRGADGSLPMNRVSRAGIHWLATGENIAKAQSAAQAEALFMDEPKFQRNHRGNILDLHYNRVGIGIARATDGSLYITQEFAEIP